MSENHQYLELQGKDVFARYQKTQVAALALTRPDPHDLSKRAHVLVITPESALRYKKDNDGYDIFDGRETVSYDDEVIEIYSEMEDKIFRRLNEKLFADGELVAYEERRTARDTSNALTQSEVVDIANLKNLPLFRSKLKGVTSLITLDRIREAVIQLGRPMSFVNALDEYKKNVNS